MNTELEFNELSELVEYRFNFFFNFSLNSNNSLNSLNSSSFLIT